MWDWEQNNVYIFDHDDSNFYIILKVQQCIRFMFLNIWKFHMAYGYMEVVRGGLACLTVLVLEQLLVQISSCPLKTVFSSLHKRWANNWWPGLIHFCCYSYSCEFKWWCFLILIHSTFKFQFGRAASLSWVTCTSLVSLFLCAYLYSVYMLVHVHGG